jgi:hypothetical protein
MRPKEMKKEPTCIVTGQKLTPYGNWVWVDLYEGPIVQCEQYMDSNEWHLIGYKNIKIVSRTIRKAKHETKVPREPIICTTCED